ncbi:hypothetical protein EV681_2674 [Advenella incenata]|uniref:Uncharacterized protein n=1 Tax=Advenella incenata TaxID=267800 RepID=A0A4Q7VBN9_9BURK|nr:hypothetical protein [Advenella incenata]RZT94256.1 hypothetical protein EV681_2674 [Advenella incenata]
MNTRAQQRLDNPLASKEFSVCQGDRLRIRVTAISKKAISSQRGLLCRILFFDEKSELIRSNYEGTFSSAVYGQFIYIASTATSKCGDWAKRAIVAPPLAEKVRLVILEGEARLDEIEKITDIQCVSGHLPILESKLPIAEQLPTKLTLRFTEKVLDKDTVLLSVSYLDEDECEIAGPYSGFAFSRRYGYFKYIHRTFLSNIFEICLYAPARTRFVQIRVHPIKGGSTIDCVGSPKLEVYLSYKRAVNDVSWRRIHDSEMIELPLPYNKEQVKICKLLLTYIAHSKDNATGFECRFLCERRQPVINASPSGVSGSFQYLSSTDNKINSHAVNFFVPASAKYVQLHFRVSNNSVLYLHSDVDLRRNTDKSSHRYVLARSVGSQSLNLELNELWSSLLVLSIRSGTNSSEHSCGEASLSFYDSNGGLVPVSFEDQKVIFGQISQFNESTCRLFLCLDNINKTKDKTTRFIAQLTPPRKAVRLTINVNIQANDSQIKISAKISAFDQLIVPRLVSDSYRLIEHNKNMPEYAVKALLKGLVAEFPQDPSMLGFAMNKYYELGDLGAANNVASHILNDVSPAALRYQARLISSEVNLLRNSFVSARENFTYQEKNLVREYSDNLTIALLIGGGILDSSTLDPFSYLSARYPSRVLSQKKGLVITPLGFPGRGETGDPWEVRSSNGFKHYLLNCISSTDLVTITKVNQIDFSVLLCREILKIERPTVIHCVIRGEDYCTVTVALAVARSLSVPLVLEFLDTYISDGASEQNDGSKIADAIVTRQFVCAAAADVIITKSEGLKRCLSSNEIDSEKIFVIPALELNGSTVSPPDSQRNEYQEVYLQAYNYLFIELPKRQGAGAANSACAL